MRLKVVGVLAILAMLIAFAAAPVAADAPNDCPDPAEGDFADGSTDADEEGSFVIDGTTVYYVVTDEGHTISFYADEEHEEAIEVEFCVKGGSAENSGIETGSTYTVDFFNGGDQHPAISNFVVYGLVEPPPPPDEVAAAAASITAPSCTAAGTLVVPANTASVTYSVEPAYTAGATGTFKVTATAAEGFVLTGTSEWTLTVAAKVTGASCVTGGGTLPGNPPVRTGTLGNTAMDVPTSGSVPAAVLALVLLSGLAAAGYAARAQVLRRR
jgi:hypothetical protein